MSVDAINVLDSGRRTHFFHAGVAAAMSPDDFDFSSTEARILHLGLPGAHAAMDALLAGGSERLGRGAESGEARGSPDQPGADDDIGRTAGRAWRVRACPHLDFLIVNDFEVGALAGVATRRADGSTDVAAVWRAIGETA